MRQVYSPRIVGCLITLIIALLTSAPVFSQTSPTDTPAAAHMRSLNNSLVHLHGQMQQADANSAQTLRGQAAIVISQRAAALSQLIQHDPHAALSFAFSPDLLADMSTRFPNSASQLEQHGTWQGAIEYWIADSANLKTHWTQILITIGQQKYELHFAGPEPAYVKTGDVVRIKGVALGRRIAVEASSRVQSAAGPISLSIPGTASTRYPANQSSPHSSHWLNFALLFCVAMFNLPRCTMSHERALARLRQTVASLLALALIIFSSSTLVAQTSSGVCSTTGVQNTVVLLVTFPGMTPPATVTPQSAHDIFFGTNGHSLDGFWREASSGQTSATGDVFGWYTLDRSYTCSEASLMRDAAIARAAADGVNFQSYTRVFVIYPNVGCTAGFALVGCSTLASPSGPFTASASYIESDYFTGDQGVELATHEGGHNLGVQHSGTLDYGTETLGPLTATGTVNEFGDYWSTMGSQTLGQYPASQKAEVLNWLGSSNYQVVQTSGTWTLQPFEASSGGLQALKIQRGTGNNAWLWVEFRQPIGSYDSTLMADPFSGALIHYEDPSTGAYTHLLDFTPDGSWNTWWYPALAAGRSWSDPYSNLSFSVVSATASGLTVNVSYGTTPCTPSNPTVTLTPLNPSTQPGNSVGYNASVRNNDSPGCPSSTFNISSSKPYGWVTNFSTTSLNMSPGQSVTIVMNKTAPTSTASGTYPVDMSVAAGALTGSGDANVTVTASQALSVSLSTNSSSYTVGQAVSMTATVVAGGNAAARASVTFTVTLPTGGQATKTVAADSQGTATWNYRVGRKDPVGAYSVRATASYSTQTATSSSVNFTVR